jgi:hypothetical protein
MFFAKHHKYHFAWIKLGCPQSNLPGQIFRGPPDDSSNNGPANDAYCAGGTVQEGTTGDRLLYSQALGGRVVRSGTVEIIQYGDGKWMDPHEMVHPKGTPVPLKWRLDDLLFDNGDVPENEGLICTMKWHHHQTLCIWYIKYTFFPSMFW